MQGVLLTARCLLAAVFLVAAAGKAFDVRGARQAIEEFGASPRLARFAGPALPLAEVAVAVALLIKPAAVAGAGGALALLIVFIGGIARALSQGHAPDCHCFGQIHSEPAGPSTLVRNVVLAALTIVVLASGSGPSINAGLGSLDGTQAALVATAVAAAVLAAAVAQLWSDRRRLQLQLDAVMASRAPAGLPPGTPAPSFSLAAVRGEASSLSEFGVPGRSAVLVFVSTSCDPCRQMLPTLARWQDSLADALPVAAVFSGEPSDIEALVGEQGLMQALAQEGEETFTAYGLRATPSAVLINSDGTVGALAAEGVPAIEALVRSALAEQSSLAIHSA